MTHTTTVLDRSAIGDREEVVADLDITSLDNADSEAVDPAAEFNLSPVRGMTVLQAENAASYVISVEQNNNIHVEAYGGTDPSAGTDVGVVRIKVVEAASP